MSGLSQAGFAAALRAGHATSPVGLRAWNGSDPAPRFAVHRNTFRSSLASALEDAFPVLRQWLGAEFFRALALAFVQASPPRSPVLLDYGEGLAEFIEHFEATAGQPCLADLARLEQLRVQAFHAADAPVLSAADFQACLAAPERLPALGLRLHPSLRLLRAPQAVLSIWQAHQVVPGPAQDLALAALELNRGEDVLIWRPQLEVQAIALPAGGFETLQALAQGQRLGPALQAGAECEGFAIAPILDLLVHAGLATELTD